jgi:hypothetical protein
VDALVKTAPKKRANESKTDRDSASGFRSSLQFKSRFFREVAIKYLELQDILQLGKQKQSREEIAGTSNSPELDQSLIELNVLFERFTLQDDATLGRFSSRSEIKKLYHHIAQSIHPDKAASEAEFQWCNTLMTQTNTAYQTGDFDQLKSILYKITSDPRSEVRADIANDIILMLRQTARIKSTAASVEQLILQIQHLDLYLMMQQVHESVFTGSDIVQELSAKLDRTIALARQRINSRT